MKRGFTLIELLVVISVTALLAGILLVSLNNSRVRAKKAAGLAFITHSTTALFANATLLYDFDDSGGSTVWDGSMSGNNGTLANGAVRQAGHIGNAVYLDGLDDSVNLTSAYLPNHDNFTVAAWFNLDPSTATTFSPIFGNYQAVPFLGYYSAGRSFIHMRQYVGGFEYIYWSVASLPSLADGAWHHVFLTVNQSTTPRTAEVYLDGESLGKNDLSGTEGYTHGNGALVRIGRDYSTSWKGLIDDAAIYRRVLLQ